MLVHGVRPLTIALSKGWALEIALVNSRTRLSQWASEVTQSARATVLVEPSLLAELAEKPGADVELIGVVQTPVDSLHRIPIDQTFNGVLFDRPTQPGTIGTLLRSIDALAGSGLVVSGHAADLYDPKSVRASTGSIFAVPSVRVPSPQSVLEWVEGSRADGVGVKIVATDEEGDCSLWDFDFTQPVLTLIGNETTGLSRAWREAADATVKIPMQGSASSLNAATAASLMLYEISRQRSSISRQKNRD